MSREPFGFSNLKTTQTRKNQNMKVIASAVFGILCLMGFGTQVASAAALVDPISTSTTIYSGILGDTAVFSLTIDITAFGTEVRIPKFGGINAVITGMPVSSIVVLSEITTSNASTNPFFDTEFVVPNGQTRRFTISDTVQARETGWLDSYFEKMSWRELSDPFGYLRTVLFTPTFQSSEPAEIQNVVITPEPSSIALLLSGALGFLARRKRPA